MEKKNLNCLQVSKFEQDTLHPSFDTINPEFSKRITSMRFAMALFIVFIHNSLNEAIHFATGDIVIDMPLWMHIIHDTMVNYWGGIAVPTFFIISGYLFYAKPKNAVKTIKSKFKGIFVPYVLWIGLSILLYYIAQSFDLSKPYFAQSENIIRNWSISDYFKAFWARHFGSESNTLNAPFVPPFWYIRDLMIMMLISPIIKFLANKFPAAWLIFITLLYFSEVTLHIIDIQYGFTTALFFFSLGYYAVQHIGKIMNFLDSISWRDFIVAYVLSFFFMVYADINKLIGYGFVKWFNLLFTIGLAIKVAGVISKKDKIFKKLSYLSNYSFWIFAAHLPLVLTAIRKISIKYIPMHGIWILLYFFGVVIVCVGVLLVIGILLKKYLPKVYTLLNGGR